MSPNAIFAITSFFIDATTSATELSGAGVEISQLQRRLVELYVGSVRHTYDIKRPYIY